MASLGWNCWHRLAGHLCCGIVSAGCLFLWCLSGDGSHGWLLSAVLAGSLLFNRLDTDRLAADLERHRLIMLSQYGRELAAPGSVKCIEAEVTEFLRERMPLGVRFEVEVSKLAPGSVRVEVKR